MNGEAGPGGVDGVIVRGAPSQQPGMPPPRLTVEPTQPGDTSVHLWTWIEGEEQPGLTLQVPAVIQLIETLQARLPLIGLVDAEIVEETVFDPSVCALLVIGHTGLLRVYPPAEAEKARVHARTSRGLVALAPVWFDYRPTNGGTTDG